jgi:hypothetical protein
MSENSKLIIFVILIFLLIQIILVGESISDPQQRKYYQISLLVLSFAITLFNPSVGLFLLIVTMLFSPEIPFGQVERRVIIVRYDDVLIILCLISWIISKVIKSGNFFTFTPLDKPILFFLLVCAISTSRGVLIKQVGHTAKAFFYVLKLAEYFLIFYLVVNLVKTKKLVVFYIYTFFVSCLVVCYIGFRQIQGGVGRVTLPFEGIAEPNTYGGYLLFMFGMLLSFAFYGPKKLPRIISIPLLLLVIYNFSYTLSRGSWLAFFPVLFTVVIQLPRTKKITGLIILGLVILSVPYMPSRIKKRMQSTFQDRGSRGTFVDMPGFGLEKRIVGLDSSAGSRVEKFRHIMTYWQEYPIFGLGITGAGFVDSQVMRTLGELGIMGLLAFIWIFKSVYSEVVVVKKYFKNTFIQAITTGYISGIVGLLIHSMTANTFLIIRIMGPFWFFTGLIMAFQQLFYDEVAVPVEPVSASSSKKSGINYNDRFIPVANY